MHVAGLRKMYIITGLSGCPATRDYCDRLFDDQLSFITRCPERGGSTIDIQECRETLPEGCSRKELENLHRELDCWAGRVSCEMEDQELDEVHECLFEVPRRELCSAVHQRLFE